MAVASEVRCAGTPSKGIVEGLSAVGWALPTLDSPQILPLMGVRGEKVESQPS